MARGTRRTGRRTDYVWGNFGDLVQGGDLSNALGQFGTTYFQFNAPGTLVRLRGKVAVNLDPAAVNERAMILCGLAIGPGDWVSGGAAPEILTDAADDTRWIWQGCLYVDSGQVGAVSEHNLNDVIEIDSKAMARVKSMEELAFVYHTPPSLVVDQTGTYELAYYVHLLIGS